MNTWLLDVSVQDLRDFPLQPPLVIYWLQVKGVVQGAHQLGGADEAVLVQRKILAEKSLRSKKKKKRRSAVCTDSRCLQTGSLLSYLVLSRELVHRQALAALTDNLRSE